MSLFHAMVTKCHPSRDTWFVNESPAAPDSELAQTFYHIVDKLEANIRRLQGGPALQAAG